MGKTAHKNTILASLTAVDRILRGEATRPEDITKADIRIPVVGVSSAVILLAMLYGVCMGVFALVRGIETSEYNQALLQTFASMCKVPLLFVLTLIVTFPSLYVFNALVGSRVKMLPVFKLLIASLAVNLAVLASMGPILAFFSVSTPNYPFIVVLNVVVFTIAGSLGLAFLIQTLNRLTVAERNRHVAGDLLPALPPDTDPESLRADNDPPPQMVPHLLEPDAQSLPPGPTQAQNLTRPQSAIDGVDGSPVGLHVRKVFICWIIVFGLVGAQMGWVLRPFIGSPGTPFSWFRARHSNFFQAVLDTVWRLMHGG